MYCTLFSPFLTPKVVKTQTVKKTNIDFIGGARAAGIEHDKKTTTICAVLALHGIFLIERCYKFLIL